MQHFDGEIAQLVRAIASSTLKPDMPTPAIAALLGQELAADW
jgi:3-oxoacyl-[acyl-carrier-protein] synthase III